MSDATYKLTAWESLSNNPTLDLRSKDQMLDLVKKYLSESECKDLVLIEDQKGRFFYNVPINEIGAKLADIAGTNASLSTKLQKIVNSEAREGRKVSWLTDTQFTATYTRGGHKYVNGVRLY